MVEKIPTQEELLAMLHLSEFDKGYEESPLREFTGRLDNIIPNLVEGKNGKPNWLQIIMKFSDVKVLASIEPLQIVAFDLDMPQSNREGSVWAILGASIGKLIPAGQNMAYCMGKYMYLRKTPNHNIYDSREKKALPKDAWECFMITPTAVGMPQTAATVIPQAAAPAGTPAPAPAPVRNAIEQALFLLDGKDIKSWNTAVFADNIIRADSKVVNEILGNTFLTPFIQAGRVSNTPDGVYHVKPL